MQAQSVAGLTDGSVRFQASMGGGNDADTKESEGLPALGPALLSRIDCQLSIETIFIAISDVAAWDISFDVFLGQAHEWQKAMHDAKAVLHTF